LIVELEHVVAQPVEQVFGLLADIERRPEWSTAPVERTKLTEGPVGVGSRYHAVDKIPGRRLEFTQEIVEYEPNRLLVESWDGPLAGAGTTHFHADGDSTRLAMRFEIHPTGVFKVFAPLMTGPMIRGFKKDLDNLESILATGSGS
jgi:uncharacterized protein YndB with AHSA1/START domain